MKFFCILALATVISACSHQNTANKELVIDLSHLNSNEPLEEKQEDNKSVSFGPYLIVDHMPSFNRKEGRKSVDEFCTWVQKQLNFSSIRKCNSGKVYVKFEIDTTGSVVNTEVIKGLGSHLNKEAIRIVQSSPIWSPGRHNGEVVNVQLTIPVVFN